MNVSNGWVNDRSLYWKQRMIHTVLTGGLKLVIRFVSLRFCLEFKQFTEEGYGYVSYLPVRQDCSNNGMQILSLLLRDKDTGRMCNLVDRDKANDMYAEFADRVYEELKKDGGVLAQSG